MEPSRYLQGINYKLNLISHASEEKVESLQQEITPTEVLMTIPLCTPALLFRLFTRHLHPLLPFESC